MVRLAKLRLARQAALLAGGLAYRLGPLAELVGTVPGDAQRSVSVAPPPLTPPLVAPAPPPSVALRPDPLSVFVPVPL